MGPSSSSALPPRINTRGYPSSYFGENQLSPGLISLSLLPTTHPSLSQEALVRSFTRCYPRFNLVMGRSPRLRVYCQRLVAHFGLAFATPPPHKGLGLPLTITRRLIKQKARHHPLRGSDTL